MDAKRCLTGYYRMCNYYTTHKEKGCGYCPLNEIDCALYSENPDLDKIVNLVEKWEDEHKKVTRLDVFNGWLKEQGVDPDAYKCIDRMSDIKVYHSCFGFACPINTCCKDCPYNGFWTKEVEV